MSDPTRRSILASLSSNREGVVGTLAKPFPISTPAISRHLRVLEHANLIERRREGRHHFIRAREGALKPAQDWLAQCAAAWNFSFDSLEELLRLESNESMEANDELGS